MLLSYKPLHLEAQQRLQEEGCVVDIKLFSGAVAGEVSTRRYIFRSCNRIFLFLVLSLVYSIKENYKKMELSLSHTLHLFNIFCEYDGKENCAKSVKRRMH